MSNYTDGYWYAQGEFRALCDTMHRFPIGTQYVRNTGKRRDVCTVVDQLTLINSKGEVLRRSYVTAHPFCGQQVTEHDVCDTTIARNLTPEFQHLLKG